MTSPIDLLTRLKAQLDQFITFPVRVYNSDLSKAYRTLDTVDKADVLALLTDLAEAVRQDHEKDAGAMLQAVLQMLGLPAYRREWFTDDEWDFAKLRQHGLNDRLAEIRACEQRVQAFEHWHLCPLHQPNVWESDGTCPICEGSRLKEGRP